MLMDYAHSINSLCWAHEAMDPFIYNSCVVVIMHWITDISMRIIHYTTNSSTITWYVCVRNLLSLAVSPDIETPHPPRLSPKQQPMNKLINFTGLLALWFQNKGQTTETGSLKHCHLYHKLDSAIWLCGATATILLLTLILFFMKWLTLSF